MIFNVLQAHDEAKTAWTRATILFLKGILRPVQMPNQVEARDLNPKV
jgi:hypothetical protein